VQFHLRQNCGVSVAIERYSAYQLHLFLLHQVGRELVWLVFDYDEGNLAHELLLALLALLLLRLWLGASLTCSQRLPRRIVLLPIPLYQPPQSNLALEQLIYLSELSLNAGNAAVALLFQAVLLLLVVDGSLRTRRSLEAIRVIRVHSMLVKSLRAA